VTGYTMTLPNICWRFGLCESTNDPRMVPFLIQTLPYLTLIARGETAIHYDIINSNIIESSKIHKFLCIYRDYDVIEISRIVEQWRKMYGTSKSASDGK
jgi:hypothetical protein